MNNSKPEDLLYKPNPYNEYSEYDPHVFRNGLGLGLGNLNVNQQNQYQYSQSGAIPNQQYPQSNNKTIAPLLSDNQKYGANVQFGTSPDLSYTNYGGQIAGRIGDITPYARGSIEHDGEYSGKEYAVGLQYTPEQLKNLVIQAEMQRNTDNFGLDANKTSGGISYMNGNFSTDITGSRKQDNYGNVDNNISAKIGYKF